MGSEKYARDYPHLGGVETVLAGMRAHPDSVELQRMGCAFLGHVAEAAGGLPGLDHIKNAQGIEGTVNAMLCHKEDCDVQKHANNKLRILACTHPSNKEYVVSAGAIDASLQTLQGHRKNAEVQKHACEAIASFVGDHEENQVYLMKIGGLESLVLSLSYHPEDSAMQQSACRALACATSVSARNQSRAAVVGAVEALVAAMQQHPEVLGLLQNAIEALSNIAVSSSKAAQAAGAVVLAMQDHPQDYCLQHCGCLMLQRVAAGNQEGQEEVAMVGGLSAIVAAMKMFPEDTELQRVGCAAIGEAPTAIAMEDPTAIGTATQVVVAAMFRYPDDIRLQRSSCMALHHIAEVSKQAQKQVAAAGGVEAVALALKRHLHDPGLRNAARLAMFRISAGSQERGLGAEVQLRKHELPHFKF